MIHTAATLAVEDTDELLRDIAYRYWKTYRDLDIINISVLCITHSVNG